MEWNNEQQRDTQTQTNTRAHMGETEPWRVHRHHKQRHRDIFATHETNPAVHSQYIDATDLSMSISMSMSLKLIDDRDGVSDRNAQPGKGYRSVGCKTTIKRWIIAIDG
jgi:hypothetical protein